MYKKLNRKTREILEKAGNSKLGFLILSIWAFFEASFWFIAPDMPLFLYALHNKKYKKLVFIVLLSSLLGAILYYSANLHYQENLLKILMNTPFVNQEMIFKIDSIYLNWGYLGLLTQAFTFMSVKIWISQAVQLKMNFFIFFLFTYISRFARFFLVAYIANRFNKRFYKIIKEHSLTISLIYIIIFILTLIVLE